MVDISDISLLDVLPQNLAQNPDVIAMSKAIDDELHAINKLIPKTTIYGLIDGLESAVLDHLAWQWNSDTWRDNWPVSLKRSVFKSIIRTKRIKGTRAAVEDVVSSLGGVVDIKEWFEQSPRGEPYTASIVASINSFDGAVPSKEMLDDVIRSIKYAKSARTLYSFSQAANISSSIGIAGGLQSVSYVRLTG
ncbi:phage tail protein I, partial [Salmonella enterica]|nr:phage tail protein I [Salmonella enterica]EIU1882027.1 phage tail protein I [Salmonella enterica]EJF5085546.1 phage tail protein I [Salmonella enterica]